MSVTDTLPRKTFARKIIAMMGYDRDQAITEIVSIDRCSADEAGRRYDLALKQKIRRSAGQAKRHSNAKLAVDLARDLVLILARDNGQFNCPADLTVVSERAGWGYSIGYETSGRVYRELVLPFKQDGLLDEVRDEDEKLVGYKITALGVKFLNDI